MKWPPLYAFLVLAAAALHGADLHLPDQIPDIVALVKAETPAESVENITTENFPEIYAINLRLAQHDTAEALRLYQEYADTHRGTKEASAALFELALYFSRYPDTQNELHQIGTIALRLAEDNARTSLALRVFDMYASTVLDPRDGAKPHEDWSAFTTQRMPEEWQRMFKIAALLAGRFPKDIRGPSCLLQLAKILRSVPKSASRGTELLELLSTWPHPSNISFEAAKILHDDACRQEDYEKAARIAQAAARQCAGYVSHGVVASEPAVSPWRKMLKQGIPSSGNVLLPVPAWAESSCIDLCLEQPEHIENCDSKWIKRAACIKLLARSANGINAETSATLFLDEQPQALSETAVLGNWETAPPQAASLLVVPQFPVREGVEVLPCEYGLMRQEARRNGDAVEVTLRINNTTWVQQWSPGKPWYDSAVFVHNIKAGCCTPLFYEHEAYYDRDPHMHYSQVSITFVGVNGNHAMKEDHAQKVSSAPMGNITPDSELAREIAELKQEVEQLRRKLNSKQITIDDARAAQPVAEPSTTKSGLSPQLQAMRDAIAGRFGLASDAFNRFGLRMQWAAPGEAALKAAVVDRQNAAASLVLEDSNGCRHTLNLKGESLRKPMERHEYTVSRTLAMQPPRHAWEERNGITYVWEADRFMALAADQKLLWRCTIPTENSPNWMASGFPLPVQPQLVATSAGGVILSGIIQRSLNVLRRRNVLNRHMDISQYSPFGGGIVACSTGGKLLWYKSIGLCLSVVTVSHHNSRLAVGSFLVPMKKRRYFSSSDYKRHIVAVDIATGNELWRVVDEVNKPCEYKTIHSIRTDGYPEDSCDLAEAHSFRIFPFKTSACNGVVAVLGETTFVIGADGHHYRLFDAEPPPASLKIIAVGDINRDGDDELLALQPNNPYNGDGFLRVLDLDGRQLWASPEVNHARVPACEDLDGDGWLEILSIGDAPGHGQGIMLYGKQ